MNRHGIIDLGKYFYFLTSSKSHQFAGNISIGHMYTSFLKRLKAGTEDIPKFPGVIMWLNCIENTRVVHVSVTRSDSRGILRRKIKDCAYELSLLAHIGNSAFVPGLAKFRKIYRSPPGKIGPEAKNTFPRPSRESESSTALAKWYADNDPGAIKAFNRLMNIQKRPTHVVWYADNAIELENLRHIKVALITRLRPVAKRYAVRYSKNDETEKVVRKLIKIVQALPNPLLPPGR